MKEKIISFCDHVRKVKPQYQILGIFSLHQTSKKMLRKDKLKQFNKFESKQKCKESHRLDI